MNALNERSEKGDRPRRREFLSAAARATIAASTGLGLPGLSLATEDKKEPVAPKLPAKRPRIGAVSWNFHSFSGGADPTEAIGILGELGFEGTDLILLARQDIKDFWTDARVDTFRGLLEKNRLALAQFVIFHPVVEGLTSRDPDERKRNLDFFEAGCKIGKRLGAPMIDIVAPWARELSGPGGYLPRYFELEDPKQGEKFQIKVEKGFDWDELWSNFVGTTRQCLERVKAHGMRFSIEHHTHCLIHDTTAFLRLWDAIRDPALGLNLDTGWTLLQREYPPVAIHKAKGRLLNVHVRDIDGAMRSFVPAGDGVMDFKAIADAARAIGFEGFLSLEQDKYPGDMKTICKRYLTLMKEALGA